MLFLYFCNSHTKLVGATVMNVLLRHDVIWVVLFSSYLCLDMVAITAQADYQVVFIPNKLLLLENIELTTLCQLLK